MTYEKFQKAVGERIREARKAAGLTQEDMAKYNFNVRHYQDVEAGKVPFTLETLYRLSKVFKVEAGEFFRFDK